MSEISIHRQERLRALKELFYSILNQDDALEAIRRNKEIINNTQAYDIIELVHGLVQEGIEIATLKTGINKFLNTLGNTLRTMPGVNPKEKSVTGILARWSQNIVDQLHALKPVIRRINEMPDNPDLLGQAKHLFQALEPMMVYYTAKENVLFPLLEKHWPHFGCLGVMWSFHDDIRRSFKNSVDMLEPGKFDLKAFNREIGKLYFTTYAIHLRDTRILLYHVEESIPADELIALVPDFESLGLQMPEARNFRPGAETSLSEQNEEILLPIGRLNMEQLMLVFSHLPVDITLVDETDKVCFYSDPPHRVFPRTKAIIGRNVRQCHPPESIGTVEEIIQAFRTGTQNEATFWIDHKGRKIMIRYFALRNPQGQYKGVLEVSQDISGIVGLTGERRLLQWNS
ncbi:MAG: DUF438 domain-containing protein [Bacteroidetes bacterium]|nr:DUF438 domain-containing protein [Bacteroidota bacterium]